jgi:hypothetical protein
MRGNVRSSVGTLVALYMQQPRVYKYKAVSAITFPSWACADPVVPGFSRQRAWPSRPPTAAILGSLHLTSELGDGPPRVYPITRIQKCSCRKKDIFTRREHSPNLCIN